MIEAAVPLLGDCCRFFCFKREFGKILLTKCVLHITM